MDAAGLSRWLERIAPPRARGAVTVALVSDTDMRRLNRQYRGKNRVTDVLSFPAFAHRSRRARVGKPAVADRSRRVSVGTPVSLGDIVIARGVAAAQARRAGHAIAVEFRVLALHGLLHLLGYDHERDNGRMQRVEARLRARGGLPVGLIERTGTRTGR